MMHRQSKWRTWLAGKLGRITSSGDFIPEIDGLRFLAIASVVVFHAIGFYLVQTSRLGTPQVPGWTEAGARNPLLALVSHGNYGVQLFFVISGFILAVPFARQNLGLGRGPSLKSYYLRRLTRLEPPFVICLCLVYFLFFGCARHLRPHFAASLCYCHNLVYQQPSVIHDVAWSLEVEVQFYLLAPLLAAVFLLRTTWARRLLLTAGAALPGIVVHLWAKPTYVPLSLTIVGQIQFFMAGFLMADLYLLEWRQKTQRSVAWDLGLVGSVLACLVLVSCQDDATVLALLPLPLLATCGGIFRGRIGHYLCTRGWVVILGGMCYTIYLYHVPILLLLGPRLLPCFGQGKYACALQVAICLAAIVPACSLLFACLERPFMKRDWPRSLVRGFAAAWARLKDATHASRSAVRTTVIDLPVLVSKFKEERLR